jgi:hypothetical protein
MNRPPPRGNTNTLDNEFGKLLQGLVDVKSPDDLEKERRDMEELRRLTSEILGEQPSPLEQALRDAESQLNSSGKNLTTSSRPLTPVQQDSSTVSPLITNASRRRRTITPQRPGTADNPVEPAAVMQRARTDFNEMDLGFGAHEKLTGQSDGMNRAYFTSQSDTGFGAISGGWSRDRKSFESDLFSAGRSTEENFFGKQSEGINLKPEVEPFVRQRGSAEQSQLPPRHTTEILNKPEEAVTGIIPVRGSRRKTVKVIGQTAETGTFAPENLRRGNTADPSTIPPGSDFTTEPRQVASSGGVISAHSLFNRPSIEKPIWPATIEAKPRGIVTPVAHIDTIPRLTPSDALRSSTQQVEPKPFTPIPFMPRIGSAIEAVNKPVTAETPEMALFRTMETQLIQAEQFKQKTIEEERMRLRDKQAKDLATLEESYNQQMQEMKASFDTRRAALEAAMKHQSEIASIAGTVSNNAENLQNIIKQFNKEKDYESQLKLEEIQAKERLLEEREKRILSQSQLLAKEKERVAQKVSQYRQMEESRMKLIAQEKEILQKDREGLERLQEQLVEQDRQRKEELALEQYKINLLKETLERETFAIQEEAREKEAEIIRAEESLETKRIEAHLELSQERNRIQQEIARIEHIQRNSGTIELEIARRIMSAEEALKKLELEKRNLQKSTQNLEKERSIFEKEAQKVHELSLSINSEIEFLTQLREELVKERQQVEQMKHEAFSSLSSAQSEANRILCMKNDLLNRIKTYDNIKNGPIESKVAPKLPESLVEKYSKLDKTVEKVIKPPIPRRPAFKAADYLKDINDIVKAQEEMHNFLTHESSLLVRNKLELETGFTESMLVSLRGGSSESLGSSRSHNSFCWDYGSFSRPVEDTQSRLGHSMFYP